MTFLLTNDLRSRSNQKNACNSLDIAFEAYGCIVDLFNMMSCGQVRDLPFDLAFKVEP